jgi:hypothetical protein
VDEQFSSSSTSIIFFLHPSDITNALRVLGFEALALVSALCFVSGGFGCVVSFRQVGANTELFCL